MHSNFIIGMASGPESKPMWWKEKEREKKRKKKRKKRRNNYRFM